MNVHVDVQYAVQGEGVPPVSAFQIWADAALADQTGDAELVVRVVDEEESQQLNREYRGKDRPTNVLSFPFAMPEGVPVGAIENHLGDLVICASVVGREAQAQGKPLSAHWAHMVVHGVLHLRGFDHQDEDQASEMEQREREILGGLGIPDPYACP